MKKDNLEDWAVYAAIIILFIAAMCLTSCMTEKKAVNYMQNHGFTAARYCATAFPVKDSTIYLPGKTTIISHTDTIPGEVIPCPPQQPGQPPVSVQCPPAIHTTDTITRTDTVQVIRENTAKIAALQQQVTLSADRAERAENGRSGWRGRCLWTWGIILVLGGGYIFFKSKISFLIGIIKKVTGGRI